MPGISMSLDLPDSGATETLGQALARTLPGVADHGAVVYLKGELGSGKTTCVRSLLRALGVAGLVRSPTYTLVESYTAGPWTCVHVDLYRLRSLREVDELGLRDTLGPNCLLLVEWPERAAGSLPGADIDLTLMYAGDGRQSHLNAASPFGTKWLEDLGRDSSLRSYVSNLT
jgi:tRNA threonylcarbamoyladenosine biosynthesis protein TsaE